MINSVVQIFRGVKLHMHRAYFPSFAMAGLNKEQASTTKTTFHSSTLLCLLQWVSTREKTQTHFSFKVNI